MALLHFDGFDDYSDYVSIARGGYTSPVLNNLFTSGGRFPNGNAGGDGQALNLASNVENWINWPLAAAKSSLQVGISVFNFSSPDVALARRLITLYTAGVPQIGIDFTNAGALRVVRGSSASPSVLGTSAIGLVGNVWRRLEVKVVAGVTDGSITVRWRGITVLALTGIQTINTAGNTYDVVGLGNTVGASGTLGQCRLDDLVIADEADAWIGDKRIDRLLPSANSTPLDGTVVADSGTPPVWQALRDLSIGTSSSSVQLANTTGQEVRVAMDNLLAGTGAPTAVMVSGVAKKTDAAATTVALRATSGTTVDGDDVALTDDPKKYRKLLTQAPGAVAWDAAKVNALELGAIVR